MDKKGPNVITFHQLPKFLRKKSNHQNLLYHKGSHTLTLKIKEKGVLSKGRSVNIKVQDSLES